MHPHMSIEDLVKGKIIPLLLNSRGRHPPRLFRCTDYAAAQLGNVIGIHHDKILRDDCYLLLEGDNAEEYGRLVTLINDQTFANRTPSRAEKPPGVGLLILEIQEKVMRFLVQLSELVLHDFDLGSQFNSLPVLPEPPFIGSSAEWNSLASVSAEAPYRPPSRVNFKRLHAIVSAKRLSSESHIHDLREDPGYFSQIMLERRDHRPELMVDTMGNKHALADEPCFWESVVGSTIENAYVNLMMWDILCKGLENLACLEERLSASSVPDQSLAEQYAKELDIFRQTTYYASSDWIVILQVGIPSSPQYRYRCVRNPEVRGDAFQQMDFYSDPQAHDGKLLWLLSSIWRQEARIMLGLRNIVDEIEYLLESDPNLKDKLSPFMMRELSDLALIAAIEYETDLAINGSSSSIDPADTQAHKEIYEAVIARLRPANSIRERLSQVCPAMGKLGNPTVGNRFYYPSDKRRNQKNIDAMRAAEKNLDQFWLVVDHKYEECGETLSSAVQHIFQNATAPRRTAEWTPPVKISNKSNIKKVENELHISLQHFAFAEPSPAFTAPQPRIKPKTRGITNSTTQQKVPEVQTPPDNPSPTELIFKLKPRAHKVFRTIFFQPNQNDLPGEIAWVDFLYAMRAVGFGIEKLMGSRWQFTPTKGDVTRGLQIHQPHSPGTTSKIPYLDARRIGGRLSRVYGWHGEMFVVE